MRPVNCFLVEHPAGLLLFDTGQSARAARPGYHQRWHPYLRLARFELESRDEAAAQVRRLGQDPARVRWVCLSHLHTDHVGGLAGFRGAEVLVAAGEWRRATGCSGRLRGYVPQHWPRGVEPTIIDLAGPPIGPFAGSYDVAGDGRLLVVPLPGHTPDHLGLLVRAEHTAWLLAGDAANEADELATAAPEIAEFCRREDVHVLTAHDARAIGSWQSREEWPR